MCDLQCIHILHFTFTLMAHCTSGAIRGSVSCSRTLRQGIELNDFSTSCTTAAPYSYDVPKTQCYFRCDLWSLTALINSPGKRAQLKRIKNGVDIEERMLFHGTASVNIQAICTFNFDWRLAGSHGCVYRKGAAHHSTALTFTCRGRFYQKRLTRMYTHLH